MSLFGQIPSILAYAFLCLLNIILLYSYNNILIYEGLYFDFYSNTLEYSRIGELIQQIDNWEWLSYSIIPLIYLVKLTLIATCLSLSNFFAKNNFNFNAFFSVAIFAELVFVLPILIKLLWFLFIQTDYDLNDLTEFYPLSALNLFDAESIPRFWLVPLQTLNFFEVAYWFLLAYGVADATGFSFKRSFGLVMSSYGVGLLLWVVLVMFLTVTFS